MTYIINLKDVPIEIASLGIILAANEKRNVAEFATRDTLEKHADSLINHINLDNIILADVNLVHFTKNNAIQFILNAYNKVELVNNITTPMFITSTEDTNVFYFLKDSACFIGKNASITRTFLGI